MVFHEIESISDLVSSQRIIIYYIEDGSDSKSSLRKSVEFAMEMLCKKNDDIIVFRINKSSQHYSQFKELYKPQINGPVALFVINREGIPLICEQIFAEDSVYQAVSAVCRNCKLHSISQAEITKALIHKSETACTTLNTNVITNGLYVQQSSEVLCENGIPVLDGVADMGKGTTESLQAISTELQIRLPDGTREKQKFDKHALLQEVYDFIHTKFNLNEFDLKTYNHNIFPAAEYERSLQELDLTPNGVIIVVSKNVVPFSNNGGLSSMFQYGLWILFGKISPIFRYVQGLLYSFWNTFFSSGNRSFRQIQNQSEVDHSRGKKRESSSSKYPSRVGNIHTLRRSEDSDDENNRYNGNSTQQK